MTPEDSKALDESLTGARAAIARLSVRFAGHVALVVAWVVERLLWGVALAFLAVSTLARIAFAWFVYLGRLLWAPALVLAAVWMIYQNQV